MPTDLIFNINLVGICNIESSKMPVSFERKLQNPAIEVNNPAIEAAKPSY